MSKQQRIGIPARIWDQAAQLWLGFFHQLRAAWTEYERDRANYLAAAMIYYALISLVPLLVLLVSALGMLLRFSAAAAQLQEQVLTIIEASFGLELRETIEQSLISFQQGSVIASVVGAVGLLFTASVLFRHLRLSFRALWKYAPVRVSGPVLVVVQTSLRERMVAFLMVLLGGGLLVVALITVALARWLEAVLTDLPLINQTTGWLLSELSPVLLAVITFAMLFKFLPPTRLRWRDIRLATLLCAVGWVIAAKVLALFGALFGATRSAYGALGGLLLIMLWMNVVSQMLFFGAELCKVIASQTVAPDGSKDLPQHE